MQKKFIITGTIFGLFAVILGAFATHTLCPVMPDGAMDSLQTGIRYQMYHALLFVILAAVGSYLHEGILKLIYFLLLAGIILFSGSIYFLTIGPLMNMDMKFLGPITPIGGLCLILAWIFIVFAALGKRGG